MSDSLIAFVSDNGHVIGIGKTKKDALQPDKGLAVAILQNKVTIIEWLDVLNESADLFQAVHLMLHKYGGEAIAKKINMNKAAFIPLLRSGEVGEA